MLNEQQRLKRFERAVAESSEAVVFIAADGVFRYANRKACKLLGYTADELVGMTVSDIDPNHPARQWPDQWEETRRLGQCTLNSTHRRKDGGVYPCEISVTFLPDDADPDAGGEDLVVASFRDLTQEIQQQSSLAASGRLIDESVNEVYIFDAQTLRFLYVNKGALANLGYSLDEMLRLTPFDVKHGYTEAEFRARIAPVIDGVVAKQFFSAVHTRKDGTRYDVDVRLQAGDYRGRPCLVALVLDVTQQRRVDRDLIQSEQRARSSESMFRAVIESAPTAILMVDDEGTIVLVNERTEEIFGYKAEELIGQSVGVLVPEPVRGGHSDLVRGFFEMPEERRMGEGRSLFGVRKDGRLTPVEVGLQPVATPLGRFVLAAVSDVATRLASEQALRDSERRYRALFEYSPVMHANLDPADLTITDCNELLARRLGYGCKREVIGSSALELCAEESREAMMRLIGDQKSESPTPTLDVTLLNADGTRTPAALNLAGVYDDEGERVLYAASWVDITELKRHTADLEQANREMEEFAYVASHDLRAPLRAIDHLASWIEEDSAAAISGDSRHHLQQLRQRVLRMETLLDDLHEYARVGRARTEPEEIDLAELVHTVAETVDTSPSFEVRCDLKRARLIGRRTPLETVVRNLVANAIKHHDGERGVVTVSTRLNPEMPREVEFTVADDGPGIPKEMRDRVFGMFQTLRPRDELEGSGMGLPLVKKHVETAGGRVWVDSNYPRGARVRFTWPVDALAAKP
ncbi:MAG: PAS domain S-box protein [Planctomycetota bacterium]